jgi:hypothetical protein
MLHAVEPHCKGVNKGAGIRGPCSKSMMLLISGKVALYMEIEGNAPSSKPPFPKIHKSTWPAELIPHSQMSMSAMHSRVIIVDDSDDSNASSVDLRELRSWFRYVGTLVLLAATPRAIPPASPLLALHVVFSITELVALKRNTSSDGPMEAAATQLATDSSRALVGLLEEAVHDTQADTIYLMAEVVGHHFAAIVHVFEDCSPVGQELWNRLISTANQPLSPHAPQGFGDHLQKAFDGQARTLRSQQRLGSLLGDDTVLQPETTNGSSTPPTFLSATSQGMPTTPEDPATVVSFSMATILDGFVPVQRTGDREANRANRDDSQSLRFDTSILEGLLVRYQSYATPGSPTVYTSDDELGWTQSGPS